MEVQWMNEHTMSAVTDQISSVGRHWDIQLLPVGRSRYKAALPDCATNPVSAAACSELPLEAPAHELAQQV